MTLTASPLARALRRAALVLLPVVLAACGGSGDDEGGGAADCSVASRQVWLRDYMADWYFWYRISPRPDPSGYASLDSYFDALLYTGTSADFPADRWSYFDSTEDFNRFYGEGRTLGYGVSVAGFEVEGAPDQPLYVRAVEPQSDAAARWVVRGDEIVSINGVAAAALINDGSFSVLTAANAGQTMTLVLRRDGATRTVTVTATEYALTPVPTSSVVTTAGGRKLGYVVVKDMISQVGTPLAQAFAGFASAGVDEVVLDLRYNGGGLVSVATTVGSYVAGSAKSGQTFASLLYNDRHSDQNQSFRFQSPASAAGVARVFVLVGPRTCSASEQVINGLRGVGVEVIAIGDTSCGKPVGFLPQDDGCGRTYSVVNFESVNARYEGRYFDGFAPTCAVAEDFTQPLGAASEPLLAAAANYADSGACPAVAGVRALSVPRSGWRKPEPGERRGMIAR
ncbi:S41 family peptidase [Rubrivivax gelatinosus]|uniref:Peptidase S41 n=1 Tax=Rubrivivax gelatinosus TaxID=28068 RepID=A0ABS1DSN5_RUBGE|nr:S41 family peptidase [Rubrivivax gelatinosus]MBK1712458.1 peptidase S41 [Rubrivivax gelatinosus]